MTRKDAINLGYPAPQATQPDTIDLRVREQFLFDGLTEMTVKFETPEARIAREQQVAQQSIHEHRMEFMRLVIAGILLIGFLGLSIYLLAFKPDATENQQLLGLAGAIVSGGGVYVFHSKTNKPT